MKENIAKKLIKSINKKLANHDILKSTLIWTLREIIIWILYLIAIGFARLLSLSNFYSLNSSQMHLINNLFYWLSAYGSIFITCLIVLSWIYLPIFYRFKEKREVYEV